ncbi:DNA binding protein [Pseudomonas sp. MAP12]|uniref:DNA binding protein n=1 Tax=Geopseudomonas aromaticivorans TaxID=2849492 RepID=A0ABS6MYX6_9GAMM|nr:histone-like nucleoid-structuring protein, MvaT/MvaU family [Pseudomonas aromaticivorans]MBV2134016.1 DNA binding protein [Pseudomonas aromaticivorans]
MSKLLEFRKAEQALRDQLARLESLKHDTELKREMEFEDKLKELLQEYGFKLQNIVDILQPQPLHIAELDLLAQDSGRRVRKIQIWKNPITGEVLETKSGNNKTLKAWKAEHGEKFVASWLQKD